MRWLFHLVPGGRQGIWDLINRYALCLPAGRQAPCPLLFSAPAGLHTDTTDIMAEMEGFGKAS